MYYHIIMYRGDGIDSRENLDYDTLVQGLVIPFVNKQVVPVKFYNQGKALINLGAVNYLRIFKTKEKLPNVVDLESLLDKPELSIEDCTQEVFDHSLIGKSSMDSKSLLQTLLTPLKKQVFVIMKFGDKTLDSAYEGVIKPIIKRFKYKPLRIDEIQDSGRITNQILEEIAQSEIVFADLTGERPNCYYEAGFAHAIGKEIIFTIHKGSTIHFDLAGHRFIEWETEEELRRELKTRIGAIKKRLNQK
jgi:nucleoside 2-deoxyribosyltransferase